MSINKIKDVIFENSYKRTEFSKESNYYSMKRLYKTDLLLLATKLMKNKPVPSNPKKHYKSFTLKEKRKPVKQSQIITYQPRIFQNQNLVGIKSIITKHPKTLRQAEKSSF